MSLFEELFWNHCNNCMFYHPVIEHAGYCGFKNSWMPATGCCMAEDFRKEKPEDAAAVQVER